MPAALLSGLPPPPSADEISGAWLRANKATLAAYMAAVYAQQTLQVVVIKNGDRLPPVTIKTDGRSSILEIIV